MDSGGPKEVCIRWGAHWCHLANTIEPSMRGGNAAFHNERRLTGGSSSMPLLLALLARLAVLERPAITARHDLSEASHVLSASLA